MTCSARRSGAHHVFASRRVLLMLPLGFASGLPYLLTGSTFLAWMTAAGMSLAAVGGLSLVSLPYSLKLAWAPLVDRYQPPLLGRRRGWMMLFQLGLALALGALGALGAGASAAGVAALACLVAFFSASQDVVGDAYRTDLLERPERAAGTSVYILGYRVAMLVSGGLALVLADRLGWPAVYALMGALMLVGVVTSWRAPEPARTEPPRTLGEALVQPLADYFRRRGAIAVLVFITLYRLADTVANVMVVPFLLALGFGQSEIGVVYKITGIVATIVGTLGGGALVARFGLYRSLLAFGLVQSLGLAAYVALALVGRNRPMLIVAVSADHLCAGLSIAALDAFLMALCNKRYSATQFALLMSAAGLAGRVVGGASGLIAAWTGWPLFFVGTMLLASPAVVLLVRLRAVVMAADEGRAEA